jgi:hypothetical protein
MTLKALVNAVEFAALHQDGTEISEEIRAAKVLLEQIQGEAQAAELELLRRMSVKAARQFIEAGKYPGMVMDHLTQVGYAPNYEMEGGKLYIVVDARSQSLEWWSDKLREHNLGIWAE